MSTLSQSKTITIQTEVRSARFNIECPKGRPPVITVQRQELGTADGEVLTDKVIAHVSRVIDGDVLAETVTLKDGTVVSVAEMAEAHALFGDKWHADDVARHTEYTARLAEVKAAKDRLEAAELAARTNGARP